MLGPSPPVTAGSHWCWEWYECCDSLLRQSQPDKDPRIGDAQIYGNAHYKSQRIKLRKALASRSINLEFMRFQQARFAPSNVKSQTRYLFNVRPSYQPTLRAFLETKQDVSNVQIIKDMIREGTKVLTSEDFCVQGGISAALGFTASWITLCYE